MILIFCHTHPPATELAALEHLKYNYIMLWPPWHLHFSFDFFIPVGYQDIHKSMDEFEFRSDPITDYGVSCPWVSENYTFTRFPMQFLFRSFQYLQITRTGIISYVFLINSWSLFQVQTYLPSSIVSYGISKHYAGSMVSDRCSLGYLLLN